MLPRRSMSAPLVMPPHGSYLQRQGAGSTAIQVVLMQQVMPAALGVCARAKGCAMVCSPWCAGIRPGTPCSHQQAGCAPWLALVCRLLPQPFLQCTGCRGHLVGPVQPTTHQRLAVSIPVVRRAPAVQVSLVPCCWRIAARPLLLWVVLVSCSACRQTPPIHQGGTCMAEVGGHVVHPAVRENQ